MNHRIVPAWICLVMLCTFLVKGLSAWSHNCDQITMNIEPQLPVVDEGQDIELTCLAKCNDASSLKLKWYNDTLVPFELMGQKTEVGNVRKMKITIKAQKWDNGITLRCLAASLDTTNEIRVKLNVTYEPTITFKTKPEVAEIGKDVEVLCLADCNPRSYTYEWTNSKDFTVQSSMFALSESHPMSYFMDEYICSVEYRGIKYRKSFRFDAPRIDATRPAKVKPFSPYIRVTEVGATTTIQCETEGYPPPDSIHWEKDGDTSIYISGSTLVIYNTQEIAAGRYTCYATNFNNENPSSASFELVVNYHPYYTYIEPTQVLIWPGQKVTFTCRGEKPGLPEAKFRWLRNKSYLESATEESQVTVTETQPGEYIDYSCQAHNYVGYAKEAHANVTVLPGLPKLVQLRPRLTVRVGDVNFQVFCSVQGQKVEPIVWLKNGHVIQDDDFAFEITSNQISEGPLITLRSTLSFRGPQRPSGTQIMIQDEGEYTCILKNDYNQTESTMQLFVDGDVTGHVTNSVPTVENHSTQPSVSSTTQRSTEHSSTIASVSTPNPNSHLLLYVIVGVGCFVGVLIIAAIAIVLCRLRSSSRVNGDKCSNYDKHRNIKKTDGNEGYKIYIDLSPNVPSPQSKSVYQ